MMKKKDSHYAKKAKKRMPRRMEKDKAKKKSKMGYMGDKEPGIINSAKTRY